MYRGLNPSRSSVGHFDPLKITDDIKKSMGQNDPLIFGDPLLVFADWQKEGFSHQLHSDSESVGEGIALGDAVHLVHAVTVPFHFFYRYQGLADNFKLAERMRIRYEFILPSEYLLDHLAHHTVLVTVE